MNESKNIAVKPPTSTDMKIYNWMLETGQSINQLDAITLMKTTGLKDTVYRLRMAGYEIKSETVYYKTASGRTKHYVNYSVEMKSKRA